ncbi:MAG: transcriptional activator NhaR [Burkholderiaceae bacterium]|nr:transcriptional activator NhaR [Burkholderiaceae bacterium]
MLNYRHLHYFWVVAKEGSIVRAAERLGVAAQTISAQIKALEQSFGRALFGAQGRGLALTEAGRVALGYADQIFLTGEELVEAMADERMAGGLRLSVGISDALPKLVAHELLAPLLHDEDGVRLICHEGEFEELVAELMLHKLDVVLADRPHSAVGGARLRSHPIGEYALSLYGAPALAARFRADFPAGLDHAPLLLPSRHSALRARLDAWFEARGVRPRIVGEFEDSALLATFGRTGSGLFPAISLLEREICHQFGVERVGELTDVREQIFAIAGERRIPHPAVSALVASGAGRLAPIGPD